MGTADHSNPRRDSRKTEGRERLYGSKVKKTEDIQTMDEGFRHMRRAFH